LELFKEKLRVVSKRYGKDHAKVKEVQKEIQFVEGKMK
jgi:hypothetical protein